MQLAISGFKTRRMPNRVILIERVVLNKIRKLGYFCPKQHQGFKLSVVHLYPNISRVPPPPPPGPGGEQLANSTVLAINFKSNQAFAAAGELKTSSVELG